LAGEKKLTAIYANPNSPNFLKVLGDSQKPKILPQSHKKYYSLSGKSSVSKDMITSI
jgi:hypothetical protein